LEETRFGPLECELHGGNCRHLEMSLNTFPEIARNQLLLSLKKSKAFSFKVIVPSLKFSSILVEGFSLSFSWILRWTNSKMVKQVQSAL
jgi:hypothetical protein